MTLVNAHTHRLPAAGEIAVVNLHKDASEVPSDGWYSAGIHPWFIPPEEATDAALALLHDHLRRPNVVALGECGLDKLARTPMDTQFRIFREQLALAKALSKPVIIHNVRSGGELLHIHKSETLKLPWLFHGFTGTEQEARMIAGHGCLLGFGKHLFNPRSKASATCAATPMEHILPETDDSAVSIGMVITRIAELKGIPLEEVAEVLHRNFCSFFGIYPCYPG
jgi:TatD DNase family protein